LLKFSPLVFLLVIAKTVLPSAFFTLKYPQVLLYNDKDMLALKCLLMRFRIFQNETYRRLPQNTVEQIKSQLDL